jgi:hypothetical protein
MFKSADSLGKAPDLPILLTGARVWRCHGTEVCQATTRFATTATGFPTLSVLKLWMHSEDDVPVVGEDENL